MMLTIQRLPVPVIARVQGIATAAGCQLVAACDLAVAAEQRALRGQRRQPRPVLLVAERRAVAQRGAQGGVRDARHRRLHLAPTRRRRKGLVNRVAAPEALDAEVESLVGGDRRQAARRDRARQGSSSIASSSVGVEAAYEDAGRTMACNMMDDGRARGRAGVHRQAQARLGSPERRERPAARGVAVVRTTVANPGLRTGDRHRVWFSARGRDRARPNQGDTMRKTIAGDRRRLRARLRRPGDGAGEAHRLVGQGLLQVRGRRAVRGDQEVRGEAQGVKVELSQYPIQDMIPKTVAALDSGSPPDVAYADVYDFQVTGKWAFDGKLEDISSVIDPMKRALRAEHARDHLPLQRQDEDSAPTTPSRSSSRRCTSSTGSTCCTTAGFKESDIPTNWKDYWSFWCDKVQPAYRQKTGNARLRHRPADGRRLERLVLFVPDLHGRLQRQAGQRQRQAAGRRPDGAGRA